MGAYRRIRLTWALAAAVGLSVVAAMVGTAATGDDSTRNVARFARIDPALFESNGAHSAFVPASLSNRPVSAILQMAGAPVAVQDAAAQRQGLKLAEADKHAIREHLKAQQDGLSGSLASAGATVVGQMQDAYNGIQVVVPQKNLAQLANLPGVTAIHAVQTFTPSNTNGVPFIGVPQAWQDTGFTGTGVKIAVIDTGIDYTHADFGGPGTVASWNAAKAASTILPTDPTLFGPGAPKVKGGYDFVGDAYNANIPGSVPHPDPNPLDCNGHGTHTAGTAAGFGVLSTGHTYTGAYTGSTISGNTWNVGPGVAPGADIYAYRVFGCAGSSDIVALAINQAVRDRVDVISMSLGSHFGGVDDPTSVASQNAFDAGITVVASAGNDGGNAYLVGSPSTANGVLSVAAMDGSTATYPGATLNLASGPVKTIDANGVTITASGPFTVKVLKNADGSVSLGCNRAEYANTAGKVVVTKRGNCARVARAVFGDEAGAAAVVMINTSPGYPPFEGQITQNPDPGGDVHTVTIPFLGALQSDGPALAAADGGLVTLAPTTVNNPGYTKAASFTSGGPRNPDSAPKPDVIAPGVSVTSAGMGTGTGSLVASGTSMACPMTAGVAVLVKQAHPDWTGTQIKAAIMNTADPSKNIGYSTRLAGSGVVQAQKAVNSAVLATTTDSLDSIKFGYVPGAASYSAQVPFTLTNHSASPATYNLSVARRAGIPSSVITLSPSSVTVPAGAAAPIQVSLSMSATAFAGLPSDDTFAVGPGGVITDRGLIVATPAAGHASDQQTLTLPFMFVPRGLSNVAAGSPSAWTNSASTGTPGHTITATLPLTNSGIHSGSADLYTWGIHDAMETGAPMDVRDVGVQVLPGTAAGSTASDRALVFLINTWGQATNQGVNEFDILIDTNGDGVPDFILVGADFGAVTTGTPNGVFAAFTFNFSTGALVDFFSAADAPMNGSTIELPTLASDLGLFQKANGVGPVKKQGLTYTVDAFSQVPGGIVDTTGSATINPFSPPVSSGDFAPLASGASTSFSLTVDTDQQDKNGALGWLVASVDNANGAPQALEVMAPSR